MSTSEIPITIKLDGNNYSYRSILFQNFLKGKGLWNYVIGKESYPANTNAKFAD